MGEFEEFGEALLAQLSVEINEEKEISELFSTDSWASNASPNSSSSPMSS